MARYIDAEKLPEKLEQEYRRTAALIKNGETELDNLAEGFTEAKAVIASAPTEDVMPVKHGHWEITDYVRYDGHSECVHYAKQGLRCSKCARCFRSELLWVRNFCPGCGAKMDEEGRVSE